MPCRAVRVRRGADADTVNRPRARRSVTLYAASKTTASEGVTNGGKKAASNAKRYPLCENRRIPFTRNPPVSCLLGRCPNPRRTQSLCSETMDKSIGCAILQIAYGQAAQRCSASCSRRSFASSCSLSSSRMRSILALAVSSSFISSRAFR